MNAIAREVMRAHDIAFIDTHVSSHGRPEKCIDGSEHTILMIALKLSQDITTLTERQRSCLRQVCTLGRRKGRHELLQGRRSASETPSRGFRLKSSCLLHALDKSITVVWIFLHSLLSSDSFLPAILSCVYTCIKTISWHESLSAC